MATRINSSTMWRNSEALLFKKFLRAGILVACTRNGKGTLRQNELCIPAKAEPATHNPTVATRYELCEQSQC